ncbi:alpha/beta fold hydrolase [Tengunoibacter tsumagoiensis]|uniref:AB hydrolase-1 domain-containing protein n=1 Tax=Tengunoibacter tsumagoiensis TaxID=2014871 RepID=A0A401ZU00_9CHLR|nr:alpha/beta hydrolase [Tengunoibacter tsumagoiensis]GCE10250.1 hypothetical protein KTT_01090 [Tengunoibacter tsumagoiensis]
MSLTKKILTTGLLVGGTLGAMAIYNKATCAMVGELDTVLTGEERRYPWKYGDMFYEVKGEHEARPLVLIHGFSPGASSYEWRKNIEALSANFRVYALDLLGFGLSDRPELYYTPEMMVDLLHDFLSEVVAQPALVVAHDQSCAYAIAVAARNPQLFERLILLSPSPSLVQKPDTGPLQRIWKAILSTPIVGEFIYNLFTSRPAIRAYYDRFGYQNPGLISDDFIEYLYTSAHQPQSFQAANAVLSGSLALDVHEPLSRLQVPTNAIWGREGELSPAEASAALKRFNAKIDIHVIDKSRMHLQEEQASHLNQLLGTFAHASVN